MDFKEDAARIAMTYISDHTTVGLGAGSTIGYVIDFLKQKMENGLRIQLVTSSFSTCQLLLRNNIAVQSLGQLKKLDLYLDGCDQVDKDLNALKSGGGIHTHEKLLASMANEFILVGDESKYIDHFDDRFPVVIELLPQAANYVFDCLQKHYPHSKSYYRISEKKDGYVITDNGNYLLDIWFTEWPPLATLNPLLKAITGVVETSLFYQLAGKAIIAGKDGVKIIEKAG